MVDIKDYLIGVDLEIHVRRRVTNRRLKSHEYCPKPSLFDLRNDCAEVLPLQGHIVTALGNGQERRQEVPSLSLDEPVHCREQALHHHVVSRRRRLNGEARNCDVERLLIGT